MVAHIPYGRQLDKNTLEGNLPVSTQVSRCPPHLVSSPHPCPPTSPVSGGWTRTRLRATSLQLDKNTFEGNLPVSLGRLTNLTSLDLAANHFTGSIPAELGNLVNLQYLQLNDNYLTGSIPASFSQLDQLQWLQLGNNQLSGQLPAGFVAFPGLTGLWIDMQHTCPPDNTGCGQTRPFRNNTFCLQTCPSFCDTCIPRKLPAPPPNTTTTIGTSTGARVNATGAPVALPPPSAPAAASTPKGASGDGIRCSSSLVLGFALVLLALL
ncbi:unnamed protein product [Closterium sp. Naga37s-1]|nr:unnamed protein product [Closterium sp. Naga37s-1]